MGNLSKWVSLIVALNALMTWGLCAGAGNATLVEDDDDSVVVEARSLTPTNIRRSRQIQHLTPLSWFQAFGEGSSCLTSSGSIGSCTQLSNCYSNQYLRQNWESTNQWLPPGQETCNFFDQYGQQSTGVCCLDSAEAPLPEKEQSAEDSGEIPTGTNAFEDDYEQQQPVDNNVNYDQTNEATQDGQEFAESGEQYQFNWPPPQSVFPSAAAAQWPPPLPTHAPGIISQWPPQAPTHPPDHHYPTHPPHPGLPTNPPTAVTSARPTYPSYRPTQRPTYPTYPSTQRPTTRPPAPTQPVASNPVARCGAKNGVSPDQERIVGGQNSSPNEWPWVVVLFNKGKQFCGGSLIDSMHILTAAHCVARMTSWDVAGLTAHLGDHNIRTTFEVMHVERKIKRLVRHKGFDFSTLHNDVAVLTMDRPVTFTREVRPICLPHASIRKTYSGQVATVAGWGSLRENGPQPSILQKVNIPIWSNAECARKYGRAAPGGIIESMVCAGQAARDSCSGDSGGPLMLNEGGSWTQIGIVSWGIGCGKGQYPGVYTRVTAFLPWIMKNIK